MILEFQIRAEKALTALDSYSYCMDCSKGRELLLLVKPEEQANEQTFGAPNNRAPGNKVDRAC